MAPKELDRDAIVRMGRPPGSSPPRIKRGSGEWQPEVPSGDAEFAQAGAVAAVARKDRKDRQTLGLVVERRLEQGIA